MWIGDGRCPGPIGNLLVVSDSTGAADPLSERVKQRIGELAPAEQRVAEYLRTHQGAIVFSTAGELGQLTQTSDATVVRAVKALGYSGLPELKRAVGQRVVGDTNPAARLRSRIEQAAGDTTALLDHILAESVERLTETRRLLDEADFEAAVDLIAGADEVLGYGLGPSELPMTYLAMRLRRLGRRARSTSATGFRLAEDLLPLTAGDVVVLSAPDRLLHDMESLLDHAHSVGARIVLLTDSLGAILADRVDLTLTAVSSTSLFTHEGLAAMLLVDALVVGVANRDPAAVTANSELLTSLRTRIVPGDMRAHRRRYRPS